LPIEWSREWSWSAARRNLASVVALLAMVGFVATAARPSVALDPTRRPGTVELVVDVSYSTVSDDVAPTRLGAIRRTTLGLIDRLPAPVRVGLGSFSGAVQTLASPTTDHAAVQRQIGVLATGPSTAIAMRWIAASTTSSEPSRRPCLAAAGLRWSQHGWPKADWQRRSPARPRTGRPAPCRRQAVAAVPGKPRGFPDADPGPAF
jgi:hypothetical protein